MRFQEVFDKWGIDPNLYETWYDKQPLLDLISAYKEAHFLPSDNKLAEAIGIPLSTITDMRRRKSRISLAVMVRFLDAIGVDPKKYLTPAKATTTDKRKAHSLRSAIKNQFMEAFPNQDDWALMVEHADEVRKLLDSIRKLK